MKSKSISICYPNYSKKAVSFTMDDGNMPMDEKLLSILKPAGMKGTFNLCSNTISSYSPDFLRSFYFGYEIANHCKNHPYAFADGVEYTFCDQSEMATAAPDMTRLYPVEGEKGYYAFLTERGWRNVSDDDCYIRYSEECRSFLESIFGEGTVGSFVWPYCQQNNERVFSYLKGAGYYAIRKTGSTTDTTGFSVPADRMAWSYNADNRLLLEVMEKYEKYPDDGELKTFIFGVHSFDFERDGNWCDLEVFAKKYGSRPDDYWYATVGEIFAYADAAASVKIQGKTVINPSELPIHLTYGDKRMVVGAKSHIDL